MAGRTGIEESLRGVPLFTGIDEAALRTIAAQCQRMRHEAGEFLFREGDHVTALYVVLAGLVRLQRTLLESDAPLLVAERRPGDHIGMDALLEDVPRPVAAQFATDGEVLILRRDDLRHSLERSPQLTWSLVCALGLQLNEATELNRRHRNLDVMGRLAAFLADAADRTKPEPSGVHRLPNLTDERIAERINTSRESVNRKLSRLKEMRVVRREGRTLIVLSVGKLRSLGRVD